MYRQGRGVPQDSAVAEKWYRRSTESAPELTRTESRPALREPYRDHLIIPVDKADSPLLCAITRFDPTTQLAESVWVHEDGIVQRRTTYSGLLGKGSSRTVDLTRLNELLQALPKGVNYVPLSQRLMLSRDVDGKWVTREYDREALPLEVRIVMTHVGPAPTAQGTPP